MTLHSLANNSARALLTVNAMMTDPSLAQNLLTKTARPLFTAPVVFRVGTLFVPFEGKSMGRRANPQNWLSRIQEVCNVLHLIVSRFTEAREQYHHVGTLESF